MELKPELGAGPLTAPVWLIGRDYGAEEARALQPFVGAAGDVLTKAVESAGWRRQDIRIDNLVPIRPPMNDWALHAPGDVEWGIRRLKELIAQFRPRLIVALGNEVAYALVEDFKDVGIQEARGYLWDTVHGRVLTTVHPAGILRDWTPWRVLFDLDLKKAKREIALGVPALPERRVHVVTHQWDAVNAKAALRDASLLSVDIENTQTLELACCGFAASEHEAFVVPAHEDWQLALIRELCESQTPKVLQNGMYDRFFLKRFAGIDLQGHTLDAMLAWHALQPELAGKKTQVGSRKASHRRTIKSLKFLASVFTRDPWWKSYDFGNEMERYTLNGRDVCITLEIARKLERQLEAA